MDWMQIIYQIFEIVIFPLLIAGTAFLVYFINCKTQEIKQKTTNEKVKEYLDLLNNTITDCVIATTQTYVIALKQEGKFDKEAQQVAFQKTYSAVMAILTEEAKMYLSKGVADLQEYIYNKIESEVATTKVYTQK